jgi:hypothetical protein
MTVTKLRKRAGFLYAELWLVADKSAIIRALSARPGGPVRLKRYFKGRGWGLKYLVLDGNAVSPALIVKAASRTIERRLVRALGSDYVPHPERFRLEAETISALAGLGLGPRIILREKDFFVREFLPGTSFQELPAGDQARYLPEVLAALDRMCEEGVFHSDTNSGNVIVGRPEGRIGFIDSEIPLSPEQASLDLKARLRQCHARFLSTLGRDYIQAGPGPQTDELVQAATAYYASRPDPALAPREVKKLLGGQEILETGR